MSALVLLALVACVVVIVAAMLERADYRRGGRTLLPGKKTP